MKNTPLQLVADRSNKKTEICRVCKEEKSLNYFYFRRDVHRLRLDCKQCISFQRKKFLEKNRVLLNKRKQEDHKKNPVKYVRYELKRHYNITVEDYNALFVKQKGRCAICNAHQSELKRKLFVDHNHTLHKIRALLCHNCNSALGLLKENNNTIKNMFKYIVKHNG